jgi:hypothetical protein
MYKYICIGVIKAGPQSFDTVIEGIIDSNRDDINLNTLLTVLENAVTTSDVNALSLTKRARSLSAEMTDNKGHIIVIISIIIVIVIIIITITIIIVITIIIIIISIIIIIIIIIITIITIITIRS